MELIWRLWYVTGLQRIYLYLCAIGWVWLVVVLVVLWVKRKRAGER